MMLESSFQETIKEYVYSNRVKAKALFEDYKNEQNLKRKSQILLNLCHSAVDNPACIFNSKEIEVELLKIANELNIELEQNFKKNSFLHILTISYKIGGHTRVCERWIENSPAEEVHSVIILNQTDLKQVPQKLKNEVSRKNGKFILLSAKSIFDKALELRKIASGYEKIILHVNMEDPIPVMAFGSADFKRPVVFFDHGDHVFWIGVSIADLVVNLRSVTADIAIKRRGVRKNIVIPLAIEYPKLIPDKEKIRKKLGIAKNTKVILTMASPYKYTKFGGYDFIATATEILDRVPNSVLLAIGPSLKDDEWNIAAENSKGRIRPIGYIANDKIDEYIAIADLALDSFPFSSLTSLLDIGKYGVSCLSLKTENGDFDSFNQAEIVCENQQELIARAVDLLKNKISENKFYEIIKNNHFPEAFKNNLLRIKNNIPNHHQINDFARDDGGEFSKFEMHNAALRYMVELKNKLTAKDKNLQIAENYFAKFSRKIKNSFRKRLNFISQRIGF